MLAIIIPIKQSWIKPDCFLRLFLNLYRLKWLKKITQTDFKILISDDSNLFAKKIIILIAWLFNSSYMNVKSNHKYYSPAEIKNSAAEYAFSVLKVQSIFFLDVDVYLNQEHILDLSKKDLQNEKFDWFPVDFLNKKNNLWKMLKAIKTNQLDTNYILQTGYVTGSQFLNKDFFYLLNGYNTQFIGYGCEDIEFIHRATLILGLREPFKEDASYFIDDRSYNVENLKGFRNFYYQFKTQSETNRLTYPKHFWHKRKNKSNYLKNRKQNDDLMIKLMKEFDRNWNKCGR